MNNQLTKKLTIIKGKGTRYEKRIKTDIDMFWSSELQAWITIPTRQGGEG